MVAFGSTIADTYLQRRPAKGQKSSRAPHGSCRSLLLLSFCPGDPHERSIVPIENDQPGLACPGHQCSPQLRLNDIVIFCSVSTPNAPLKSSEPFLAAAGHRCKGHVCDIICTFSVPLVHTSSKKAASCPSLARPTTDSQTGLSLARTVLFNHVLSRHVSVRWRSAVDQMFNVKTQVLSVAANSAAFGYQGFGPWEEKGHGLCCHSNESICLTVRIKQIFLGLVRNYDVFLTLSVASQLEGHVDG